MLDLDSSYAFPSETLSSYSMLQIKARNENMTFTLVRNMRTSQRMNLISTVLSLMYYVMTFQPRPKVDFCRGPISQSCLSRQFCLKHSCLAEIDRIPVRNGTTWCFGCNLTLVSIVVLCLVKFVLHPFKMGPCPCRDHQFCVNILLFFRQ